MIDARLFDDIASRLDSLLPPGAREVRRDFEKNAKATLQGALGGLDLVTREEFDVQAAVLSRTRAKLDALEARLAALEAGETGDAGGAAKMVDAPDEPGAVPA